MSAKGSKLVTLLDVSKNKDKRIGDVAEVLLQENQMLMDIPYKEMNGGTIHTESIRSGLPAVYYRKANQAIPASKSTTEERTFQAAHFESKSQIDEAVAKRGGLDMIGYNRWDQAQGHIQAQANEHASLTIYGSPIDSNRKVPGFFDVYSTTNTSEATSKNVIDGGGTTGDNCSILLVHWGERSIFGVYPKGTQAGLKRTDRNADGETCQILGTDSNGDPGTFYGYEEQFEIDHGLVIKDYRQAVRICNIDPALLLSGVSAADLIKLMIRANYKIHSQNNGQGIWYVNRTVEAFLHLQALDKVSAGAGLTYANYQGEQVLMFLGKPVRRSDALLNTEDQVTNAIASVNL